MAQLPGLPDSYADAAYGDTINFIEPWLSASDDQKDQSLQWGTVYIDACYNSQSIDQDNPSDGVKTSNSLLAQEHLTTPLFDTVDLTQPQKGLTKNRVKAGEVESEKTYNANLSNKWSDPFPEVTALLMLEGVRLRKGGLTTKTLIRR